MTNPNNSSPENKDRSGSSNTAAGSSLDRYTVQPKQQEQDSPFYKSAAPVISLPKGGGALKGIDEKFSVNAVNGTAGVEIALPLSPGRGGFTPSLGLSYSSGSGNSECGLGWNLSLLAIQRKTDKKLPLYFDEAESDVFLLAGAEDLIPKLDAAGLPVITVSGIYTIKHYIPRIEGLFAKIEYIRKTGTRQGWWRVTTKENITTYYGLTVNGRIADPEDAGRIFKWLPQLTLDHKGNVQQYEYIAEDLRSVPQQVQERNRLNGNAPIANTYLKQALYCNRQPWFIAEANIYEPSLPTGIDWLMKAVIDYGDHSSPYNPSPDQPWPVRYDAFSDFHAGFEIRTWRRLQRVLMFHAFDELNNGDDTLVRSLSLQYRNDSLPAGSYSEVDYITSATQTGHKRVGSTWQEKSLPAMVFNYEELNWDTTIHAVTPVDAPNLPQGLTGPYQWIDFDGEGISGVLTEQGSGWFYNSNMGDGVFAGAKTIAPKPSFTGLGSALQWQDLDADGRRQVVSQEPAGYWELSDVTPGDKPEEWLPFRAFAKKLNIDLSSPFVKTLDLNGDGRPDILVTEDRAWTWYENEGTKGWDEGGQWVTSRDEEKGPVLLLRDAVQSIFLADLNGDGLTDLVRIRNGEVCYWPNMGYGKFGAKVTMANAPTFASPDIFNPVYLTLADISGTGAADIIYVGNNKCTAWLNQSGNGWGLPVDINPLPATDAYSKIAILDFLGNGTGCIVWSSPLPRYATAPMQYIDLMGGKKPYLLRQYENGMGKTVSVQYRSSTQFYLEDKKKGITWATKLPFPVHCISSVTTADIVSETSYTQLYSYRHGYYDHEEREFRGFGYVETRDTDTAIISDETSLDQYPVLTKTWHHTGAWMRERQLTERFLEEYYHFAGWDDLAIVAQFPAGMNAQETREAYRALKGSPLRQEVYALDNTPLQSIPYSVTATAYLVKEIQQLGPNRYASFLNLQQQQVAFSCERNPDDSRVLHSLTLDTDEYGNVLQQAQVAYARRLPNTSLPAKVQEEQARIHITATNNYYTNDVLTATTHRLRLPWQSLNYEVVLNPPASNTLWQAKALQTAINTATEIDFSEIAELGEKRLIAHNYSLFYNDVANAPLGEGIIESQALPYEQYTLAFTGPTLTAVYDGRVNIGMLADEARYTKTPDKLLYWIPSGRALFSSPAANFYTPLAYRDPWGVETAIAYWNDYWLLPQSTTDAAGNTNTVNSYSWYNLQPTAITDLNDNLSEILYDALGMPVAIAVKGKGTEGDTLIGLSPDTGTDLDKQTLFWGDPEAAAADLLQGATWRCVYNFDIDENRATAVGMIAREQHHAILPDSPLQIRLSYSDGIGRVIMHKAQAQPEAPTPTVTLSEDEGSEKRWVGSGRTIYNNKGNAVMQYEPYFSDTHYCDTAEQAAMQGVSPRLHYDALNRNYRTDLPDGSFTKTTWTAWEQLTYDNNDTVLESAWYAARISGAMGPEEQDAAEKAAAHANTPTLVHTDTLARPFYTIQYLSPVTLSEDEGLSVIESYVNLDIQGNRLSVVDGRGLQPLTYAYNMLQQVCHQYSIDSGNGYTLTDVAGQPLYGWDADDRRSHISYDNLRRPLQTFITEGTTTICTGKMEYGEGLPDDKLHNYRGQLYRSYDSSGMQQVNGYDFKGNPLTTQQQLLQDHTIADVDWDAAPVLSSEVFTAASVYDALSRPVSSTDPGGNTQQFTYDKGGALKAVQLNSTTYVQDIHYDAKGQRQAIWYGNGTKTSYTYDAQTFRLTRLLTVRLSNNTILQDLHYWYDPVGNITTITDNAQQTLFYNNTIISPTQRFTYDALYRIITAEGREQIGTASFGANDNYNDAQWCVPLGSDATQRYIQHYTYDAVGNILQLRHVADAGSYTRDYTIATTSNRMNSTTVAASTYSYTYDTRGNMTVMPQLSTMVWNKQNELSHIEKGTMEAWYQYSGGQRVRKYVNKAGIKEERIYLGNFEIYRKFDASSLKLTERITVHVMDDTGRIAMLEKRTYGTPANDNDTDADLTRYIYSNHIQSASLELDDAAAIISYEEYHPYGTTSYQATSTTIKAVAKRYRYTGKERDEESGLYYHGARYYIPWLCRWTAVDPINSEWYNLSKGYGAEKNKERHFLEFTASPYEYCLANPINGTDPTGEQKVSELIAPPKKVPVPSELLRNLPKGGELPKPDLGRQLRDLVKSLPKPDVKSTPVGPKSPVPLRPNPIVMLIYALTLSTPAHAPSSNTPLFNQKPAQTPAPFNNMEDKEKYLEAQRITNDFNKLSEQDKNRIANRIATGNPTAQDLLFADKVMKGTGRGTERDTKFGENWPKESLMAAILKFTPNFTLTSTDQKLLYNDANTHFEIIYDKEGDYFRVRDKNLTGRRSFTDMNGVVPNNKVENGRTTGRTQDEYNQATHFKNTDRAK